MAPRTSDTRGEVQQQVEHDVDREIENKGTWAKIFATITRDHTAGERVDNQMADQARALREGVEVRPGPALRCSNYQACSHSELQKMVTEDVDPGVVGDMGELWINAGNRMSQFQIDVSKAIRGSEADWRGKGGDSARKFMADVGDWVGRAGTSAQLAGTQTQQYSAALANAKNSMPEPVAFDVDQANADLSRTTDPIAYITKYSSYMAKYEQQQNAHQQAVQVLGMYDGTLGGSSTMPAFTPPPAMSGDTPGEGGTPGDGRIPGGGSPPIPGGPGGIASVTGNGPGPGGSGTTTSGSTAPGDTSPGGTTPGGTVPGPQGLGTQGSGTGTQGAGPGGRPGGFGNPGGNNPGSGNLTGGSSSGSNPGAGSGDSGLGAGFVPGGGSGFGGGAGGGRGGLGSGGGVGGPGTGSGRGVGAGGQAGTGGSGAEQGRAGARGPAGVSGVGGIGAGRGQGGEDDEHQRPSYLVEPDPDSIFGSDEITTPPVIGG
ncbi:hypothetical protein JOF56_011224 [Kibdelosporangium banguiense]|uniref:PPE family domain-containing protein n=1 Tax=Kibdelosporangium banguiense TaxID=1365924 RepID=A0ABS4U2F2_9PSEU|nr:hypothetical protein [Kibdelosporangium banguiense]MBP2330839.1 hypothetical protein [Kibdelosporangium banguiense]